jgi:hypothetical protein
MAGYTDLYNHLLHDAARPQQATKPHRVEANVCRHFTMDGAHEEAAARLHLVIASWMVVSLPKHSPEKSVEHKRVTNHCTERRPRSAWVNSDAAGGAASVSSAFDGECAHPPLRVL